MIQVRVQDREQVGMLEAAQDPGLADQPLPPQAGPSQYLSASRARSEIRSTSTTLPMPPRPMSRTTA